jgi:TDG/mug DNA glycosylase family protein
MQLILTRDRIGFTDVCKTASSMAHQVRAADFRAGAARLATAVDACRPRVLWFHGATAYRAFCRQVLQAQATVEPGVQPQVFAGAPIFVTPNPSPANARYSLDELIGRYRELADFVAAL